ncbi:hypothetical protein [Bifidobacterium breve]|nr:hypothetical protein [Bifidobacterium breve]
MNHAKTILPLARLLVLFWTGDKIGYGYAPTWKPASAGSTWPTDSG